MFLHRHHMRLHAHDPQRFHFYIPSACSRYHCHVFTMSYCHHYLHLHAHDLQHLLVSMPYACSRLRLSLIYYVFPPPPYASVYSRHSTSPLLYTPCILMALLVYCLLYFKTATICAYMLTILNTSTSIFRLHAHDTAVTCFIFFTPLLLPLSSSHYAYHHDHHLLLVHPKPSFTIPFLPNRTLCSVNPGSALTILAHATHTQLTQRLVYILTNVSTDPLPHDKIYAPFQGLVIWQHTERSFSVYTNTPLSLPA